MTVDRGLGASPSGASLRGPRRERRARSERESQSHAQSAVRDPGTRVRQSRLALARHAPRGGGNREAGRARAARAARDEPARGRRAARPVYINLSMSVVIHIHVTGHRSQVTRTRTHAAHINERKVMGM